MSTENTEDVNKTADSTTTAPSTVETDEEKEELRKENERLRKANQTLNKKVNQPKEEIVEQVQEVQDDPLATREGWMNEIDKRSEAKAKAFVQPILDSNLRRATDRFLKSHPEYAADQEKLASITAAAKAAGKVDEEEIFEVMGQAWASANWRDLQAAHTKKSESRTRAQATTVAAAGGSEGTQVDTTEYTEDDRAEAERMGKPIEKYMKAKRLLEQSSINI